MPLVTLPQMLCDFLPPKRCLLVGPEERKAMERKMQESRTMPTQMLNTTVSINANGMGPRFFVLSRFPSPRALVCSMKASLVFCTATMTEAANPAKPESSSVNANVEAQGMRPKQSQHLSMHLQHPPSPSVISPSSFCSSCNNAPSAILLLIVLRYYFLK